MPQLESNNKGQPGGGAGTPGYDYTDFGEFYDAGGTGSLIGENGLNGTEQGTVALSAGGGIIGDARGPCDGNFGAGGRGFGSTFAGGSTYDTRVSSGFQRLAMTGWFNLSNNTNDQEFASQARAAAANNTKQWMLRCVWQNLGGAGNDGGALFIWDHSANVFRTPTFVRIAEGAMPTGVWCMIGISVDLPALEARSFMGVPGEGTYYHVGAINTAWNAFEATALDVTMFGIGSGFSSGGTEGLIDHITWWGDRSFEEADFLIHWADGNALQRASYFQAGSSGGGATVHNAHGTGGNLHGAGGNR